MTSEGRQMEQGTVKVGTSNSEKEPRVAPVPGESLPDGRGRRDKDLSGCFNVHIMAE
jgi:hypothetical protein